MDQIRSMASNCKTSENAATSDMDSLLGGEYPSTDAGKCLHACMQETLGIVRIFLCFLVITSDILLFLISRQLHSKLQRRNAVEAKLLFIDDQKFVVYWQNVVIRRRNFDICGRNCDIRGKFCL